MTRLFWTPLALDDLQKISTYIENQDSIRTANRVCRAIYDAVQQLKTFPGLGRNGLEAGTLELVVAQYPAYLVAYRVLLSGTIHILRIWHAAQNRP